MEYFICICFPFHIYIIYQWDADGPIAKAKIGVAFSLATDASDDLYFSELTLNPNDIRKIALN